MVQIDLRPVLCESRGGLNFRLIPLSLLGFSFLVERRFDSLHTALLQVVMLAGTD